MSFLTPSETSPATETTLKQFNIDDNGQGTTTIVTSIPFPIQQVSINEGCIYTETGFGYTDPSTSKFIWNADPRLHPISHCSNITSLAGGLIVLTLLKNTSLQCAILQSDSTIRILENVINPLATNIYYTKPDIHFTVSGKFYVNHVLKGDKYIGEGKNISMGRGGYVVTGYGGEGEEGERRRESERQERNDTI